MPRIRPWRILDEHVFVAGTELITVSSTDLLSHVVEVSIFSARAKRSSKRDNVPQYALHMLDIIEAQNFCRSRR